MRAPRRRLHILFIPLAFAGCTAAAPRLARAADPSSTADDALQRGIELRKEGRDTEALQEFERAYAVAPTPRARAQIGLAEQALGRWVTAEEHLKEALAARDDPWIAHYAEPLEKALATVGRHLGSLDATASVAGAALSVNGARAGDLPLAHPIRVVAGTAVLAVHAPGYVEVRRTIEVAPGATMHEEFTLVAEPPPGSVPPAPRVRVIEHSAPPADSSATLRTAGVITAGVGVAGLAVGGVFGLRTLSDKSDRDAHCAGSGCDARGVQLDHDARTHATISTIGFGAGALCIAAGAVLFWRGTRAPDRATGLRVVPAFGSGTAGITAIGAW